MSAVLKAATVASGLGLFSAASLYSLRNPKQDFSKQAQALEHTAEAQAAPVAKPKLPSNFFSFTIKGQELFSNASA